MTIYIAMLRGINVGGNKIVPMESLRASFKTMGFKDIATYVQSGNVVFKSASKSAPAIIKQIEQQISTDFGFPIPVILRTARELDEIIKLNPLVKDKAIDQSKLHVTFLSKPAPATAAKILDALAVKPERFHIHGKEIYLYCPNGYGNTKLSNNTIEKKLGVGATTRNWKSVNALLAMTLTNISP